MWISWRLYFVVVSSVLFGFVFNTTSFLIKHKTSSSFLSISPKDEFFFLYPYNCRTFNHIFWTSGTNGQILSSNGKDTKFMTKAEFDVLPDKNGVEVDDDAVFIPTTRDDASITSSTVEFVDGAVIKITIKVEKKFFFISRSLSR